MNAEILKLQQQLIASNQALATLLGSSSDPDTAEAILREMEEINFRVMMAGRLLFKETTARIDEAIETVLAASADLDQAIKQTQRIADLIKAVGKFLTVADKVLDKIKLL